MKERWSKPNGYRQVLSISLPLVASMGSITLMQFTDRIFLANYSVDAIAAAIYFALIAAVLLASFYFISEALFELIGHSPHIRSLEVAYFNILTLGAGLIVLGSAMACFYTGRGLTWTVMLVHMAGATINIPLDYCLINGVGPFPELGIVGAAIATVTASAFIVLILIILIFNPNNRARFGTWKKRAFDKKLFGRLMHYGLPSGIQFFLEIFGITFFIQMLGRLGDLELAASNIVLSIETLAFLPMVGFHIGNATLVGQAIGRGQPEAGVYSTTSALHITLAYMLLLAAIFVIIPEPLLYLFKGNNYDSTHYAEIMDLGVILMRFVAVFCFFDALNLIYSGAIKGAGDTRFIMWTIAALSLGVMIVPVYIAIEIIGAGLYTAWTLATIYICSLGLAFMLRYRQGKWKKMRVIEVKPVVADVRGRGASVVK
jgi:MATE family multidrug resistance protein